MIFFWILLGILVFLFLISMLPVHLIVDYRENITLTLSVLFLKFRLFPQKKEKVRLSEYSNKAIRKRKRRALKAAKKKKTKEQNTKKEEEKEKDILEKLKELRDLLVVLLDKTFGHLFIRTSRIRISVATGDAASTAILFGAVNGAVIALLELLDRFGKLKTKSKDEIKVFPDYLAEQTTAEICLVFSLHAWQILDIFLKTFFTYIQSKKEKVKS